MDVWTFPRAVLTALVVTLIATACTDSGAPQFQGPPPLPGLQSMTTDLSLFEGPHPGSGSNFDAAVALLSTAAGRTTASMPLSVALFDGADAEDPESQSNGYHWIYSATNATHTYDVNLTGRARGVVDAVWEMRVTALSATPPLTNFILVSGRSQLNSINGEWRIFDPTVPATPTPLVDVSWFHEGPDTWRVVLRNVKAGSPDDQDYLEYQEAFDLRRAIYFDASVGSTLLPTIDWHRGTHAGSIDHVASVNGGAKACWGAELQNIACP